MRCANTKHINDFLNNQDKDTKENEKYELEFLEILSNLKIYAENLKNIDDTGFRLNPKLIIIAIQTMKLKVIIQRTNDFKNYIVIADDGREFIVRNIDEAIELKEKLQNEN